MAQEAWGTGAIKRFSTGENFNSYLFFGCHFENDKFSFRVWAPNAQQVWLVGDFNNWSDSLPMNRIDSYGIWELSTDKAKEKDLYKFKIKQSDGREVFKFDPYATFFEQRPNNAAYVHILPSKSWSDTSWQKKQKESNYFKQPINIYEVHASSWRTDSENNYYDLFKLTSELIPYVKEMGYTHIEFMPLMEHPLGMSWGYQLIGYFAFCSYFGTPEDFQEFVEQCHINNIGVIVDWVPGHFCVNDDALAYYDGTPQFEYSERHRAENVRWGSLNFDLGKPEVQSFLISSAMYWIETFHLDGIRVDAVSSMIYRDYDDGMWTANHEGGNRNFEGYYFLQKLNAIIKLHHPEVIMIAEESSSETQVTGLIETGALGFDYKWNMGWMNDTLKFYEMDPYGRKNNFNLLTFSFVYMMNENYILPFSHDEVVHGKKSLMHKMWGDRYKQFSQLRNMYVYLITHPGKKLMFMGSEWGQFLEWKYDEGLEWIDLEDDMNYKMQHFTRSLNSLYQIEPSLWEQDHTYDTIQIIDADNRDETVLSFIRKGIKEEDFLVVVLNMTPIERCDFCVGVPVSGKYQEILNTEMYEFGGTWTQSNEPKQSFEQPFKQFNHQIKTIVPALGAIILKLKSEKK